MNTKPDGATPDPQVRHATLTSDSPATTRHLGVLLGHLLLPGDVILLHGQLGAGKTALAQGIGEGLGVSGTINSPTFTLLKEYEGRLRLYHFDLYRIEDPDEVYALGFDDYFGGEGVSVVEWAERGERAGARQHEHDRAVGGEPAAAEGGLWSVPWPEAWLRITLRADGPQARMLDMAAHGVRGTHLLAQFRAAAHHEQSRQGEGTGHVAGA